MGGRRTKIRGCFGVKKRVFLKHSVRLLAKSADIKIGGKQCKCNIGEHACSFVRGPWASLRGNDITRYVGESGPSPTRHNWLMSCARPPTLSDPPCMMCPERDKIRLGIRKCLGSKRPMMCPARDKTRFGIHNVLGPQEAHPTWPIEF